MTYRPIQCFQAIAFIMPYTSAGEGLSVASRCPVQLNKVQDFQVGKYGAAWQGEGNRSLVFPLLCCVLYLGMECVEEECEEGCKISGILLSLFSWRVLRKCCCSYCVFYSSFISLALSPLPQANACWKKRGKRVQAAFSYLISHFQL